MSPTFRRLVSHPALMALCLFAIEPTGALAQTGAGSIEFVSGEATLRSATGVSRPATRGSAIASGDSIETAQGRVQLRMVDGAYISLQPQTLLRVEDYRMAGSTATEERGFLGLLRGGLRTVTGSIGRVNRAGYRLTTPTATVGIRGTAFSVSADAGTRLAVTEGIAALCNNGGCVDVGAGQSGFTPDTQTRPALAFRGPSLPPTASGQQASFVIAEDRNDRGQSVAVPTTGGSSGGGAPPPSVPLANGPGPFPVIVHNTVGAQAAGVIGGTFTFNGAGLMTQFVDCCSANGLNSGASTDFGADGVIAWGRWTSGNSTLSGASGPITSVQYISALNANAATIPIVRAFTSFASSAPTIVSGAGALVAVGTPNSVTGAMTVNFPATSGGSVTYNLSIPVAGQTFTVNGTAAQFSTTAFLGSTSTITSSTSLCAGGVCVGNIPFGNAFSGVITGAGATRAGGVFGFNSTLGKVAGSVVFQ
ncbi:MAG: FecR domain-containing protein [Burkholderiales bacterium]